MVEEAPLYKKSVFIRRKLAELIVEPAGIAEKSVNLRRVLASPSVVPTQR
jgi:hypothetical protein